METTMDSDALPQMWATTVKTEGMVMHEIEMSISALMPEAQRRVLDWIRARWAPNGHDEPKYSIRGTPLTSGWPHEAAARAPDYRRGVLEGGISSEEAEQLLSDADEADGPNEEKALDEAVISVISADDEALAMLDEADWAASLLKRLQDPNPAVLVNALREVDQPGVRERFRTILLSPETAERAILGAMQRYPDGGASKAKPVEEKK